MLGIRACALPVAVLSISVAAQERRVAPLVPADMLEGQRLVDKESGISILAPDNWVWVWLRQGLDRTMRAFATSRLLIQQAG